MRYILRSPLVGDGTKMTPKTRSQWLIPHWATLAHHRAPPEVDTRHNRPSSLTASLLLILPVNNQQRKHQVRNRPYIMRDPTAELSPVVRERLPPPTSLEGRTVGLLSISKERSNEFLSTVAKRLTSRGIAVARFEKPTHTKPAPEDVIQAIVGRCDVVVEGLAD